MSSALLIDPVWFGIWRIMEPSIIKHCSKRMFIFPLRKSWIFYDATGPLRREGPARFQRIHLCGDCLLSLGARRRCFVTLFIADDPAHRELSGRSTCLLYELCLRGYWKKSGLPEFTWRCEATDWKRNMLTAGFFTETGRAISRRSKGLEFGLDFYVPLSQFTTPVNTIFRNTTTFVPKWNTFKRTLIIIFIWLTESGTKIWIIKTSQSKLKSGFVVQRLKALFDKNVEKTHIRK
jgi:hypothetical protein